MDRFRFRVWKKIYPEGWIDLNDFQIHPQGSILEYDGRGIFRARTYPENLILMQCTGLKDRKNALIYEGDILKHPKYKNFDLCGEFISEVRWGETGDSDGWAHGQHFEYVVGSDSLADVYTSSEVVGNIYEHPELLKQVK